MKRFRPIARLSWPRLLLALWLACAVLLQPAFAAACDVDDVRQAMSDAAQDRADALHAAADNGDANGAEDCCSNPLCGDCCLSATATLPASTPCLALRADGAPLVAHRADFTARAPSVDIRPPIQG